MQSLSIATAGLSLADISAPNRYILRKQKNTSVNIAEVTGIDTQEKRVLLNDRSIADYLVIATDATHSCFGHDEWEQSAPGLKTIVDATSIRRKMLLAFEAAEVEPDEEWRKTLLTFVLTWFFVLRYNASQEYIHKEVKGCMTCKPFSR